MTNKKLIERRELRALDFHVSVGLIILIAILMGKPFFSPEKI
jgi:hypothetical protein